MKNEVRIILKKILIAVVLILFIFQNVVFAKTSHEMIQQDSATIMVKLGLLKGYKNGDLGLEKNITRAEFAAIIIRMMGYEAKPFNVGKDIYFKDLSKKHWAYSSIRMAASKGYIKGYKDKTFKPSKNITYTEAIAIMIRILGYDDQLKGKWPNNYLNKAKDMGITQNLNVISDKAITRGDVSILVVNSLPVELRLPNK